jgi:hypothetical protein
MYDQASYRSIICAFLLSMEDDTLLTGALTRTPFEDGGVGDESEPVVVWPHDVTVMYSGPYGM